MTVSPYAGPHVAALQRFPVKGLSPEPLEQVAVTPGETLPGDRRWALENGGTRFDPEAPRHLPKIAFLVLMAQERLAELTTRVDLEREELTVTRGGVELVRASLSTADGRRAIEATFQDFMAEDARGPIRLRDAPGHAFTDVPVKCLHLINLASVRDLAADLGRPIDPLRFRANMHLEGLEPWVEQTWIGRTVTIGAVRLDVLDTTTRCAATNVDPATAQRDMTIPDDLDRLHGHRDFGIYATVRTGGTLAVGAALTLE